MLPKPSHLSGDYGAWFKDPALAAAYPARPSYPAEAIALLESLIVDQPRRVLDIGCGTGEIARRLAPGVAHVDAVDFSGAMLQLAHGLPGGSVANVKWIEAAVETAPLAPPYALITAGESLHWMAWDVVLPRLGAALTGNGVLAVLERGFDSSEVWQRVTPIVERYSPVRDYRPYALIDELEQRELFVRLGYSVCAPEPWRPTIDQYLEARHSQRGLSRTHMGREAVAAFDAEVRSALRDVCVDGRLELSVHAQVTWGKPAGVPS